MRVRIAAASILGLLAVLASPAQAEIQNPTASTPTTLYFHLFDTFNNFAINTQPMDVDYFEVGGTNFPSVASQGYDFNTIYGFSTSGPVEYDFIENGRPRYHPERGIAQDVMVDDGVQPVCYLYLDVRDLRGQDILPNMLPSFTFRVTMRTGNVAGDTAELDAGELIMSGEVTAHVLDTHAAGLNDAFANQTGPDDVPIFVPDGAGIVEFAIPMAVASPLVPKADAFNVRIDWYQNPSGDDANDDQAAEGFMRLVADQEHLPRLELNIHNPVYIEFIHPQAAAGLLLIHMGVNSPWGTYDVDVGNITLDVSGPTAIPPDQMEAVVLQNAHVHGLHDKAAELTWLWRYREHGGEDGDYSISVRVPNLAGSAAATGTAGFHLSGDDSYGIDEQGEIVEAADGGKGKDSPGPGLLVIAALLGVALLARRWRA